MYSNHHEEQHKTERSVLGGILLDNSILEDVFMLIPTGGFYAARHNRIYEAIIECYNKKVPADILTVSSILPEQLSYIAELTSDVYSSANIMYHAKQLRDEYDRRRLYNFGREIVGKIGEGERREEIFEWAGKEFSAITENIGTHKARKVSENLLYAIEEIEKRFHDKKPYSGIPTGFTDLDDRLDGLHDEYIVIGARPSVGKTAFALSIAANLTIRGKVPTGFISLEMSEKLLTHRLIAAESRMDSLRLRRGLISLERDFCRITEASTDINDAPLYLFDEPNANILQIKSEARNMRRKYGIKVLFIDYLGLITTSQNGKMPRHEEVSGISREMKSLSRELEIPVIALAQLGRDADGKRPMLRDLRDSGSIEQDADTVMFIYKEEGEETTREIIIAKQRNGPIGNITLAFHPEYTRFDNLVKKQHLTTAV